MISHNEEGGREGGGGGEGENEERVRGRERETEITFVQHKLADRIRSYNDD